MAGREATHGGHRRRRGTGRSAEGLLECGRGSALVTDRPPETILAVEIGTPVTAILASEERIQAGLIVMGAHGLNPKPLGTLASVAEQVVRTAECRGRQPPRESLVEVTA